MSELAVEFRDIHMHFGDKIAVSAVDLAIKKGEFLVLLGPSGGGKTTLLNILGGFLQPTRGQVLIDGEDVTGVAPAQRSTTTVFQDYALFPHMSVAKNVAFGLKMRGCSAVEQKRRALAALEMVSLDHLGSRRIHELSGGQRQRIALARALAVEPAVLLLDEPLGALDMKLRRKMQEELKQIQQRVGTTFVHVTHDQEEAMAIADTIVVMNDGAIEDVGNPERVYMQPATRFTAGFMGESNFLDGLVETRQDNRMSVMTSLGVFELDSENEFKDKVKLSIRPEHLKLKGDNSQSIGKARVEQVGFFGTHHQCALQFQEIEEPFKIRLPQSQALISGNHVEVFVDPADIVVLPV